MTKNENRELVEKKFRPFMKALGEAMNRRFDKEIIGRLMKKSFLEGYDKPCNFKMEKNES